MICKMFFVLFHREFYKAFFLVNHFHKQSNICIVPYFAMYGGVTMNQLNEILTENVSFLCIYHEIIPKLKVQDFIHSVVCFFHWSRCLVMMWRVENQSNFFIKIKYMYHCPRRILCRWLFISFRLARFIVNNLIRTKFFWIFFC